MSDDARQPGFDPGDLVDGSEKGPVGGGDEPTEVDISRADGGDGEAVDLTGAQSDAYLSGQDEGSID